MPLNRVARSFIRSWHCHWAWSGGLCWPVGRGGHDASRGPPCACAVWSVHLSSEMRKSTSDEEQVVQTKLNLEPGAWPRRPQQGHNLSSDAQAKKKKKMPVHVSHWLWWLLTRISVVIASSYWEAFPFHPQLFGWGLAPPSGASTAPVWSVDVPVLEMPICHPSHSLSAQLLLLQVQGSFLPCSPH